MAYETKYELKITEEGILTGYEGFIPYGALEIPDGTIEINANALANTDIQELILPNSVEKIGEKAFANNRKLRKITLGTGITEIGNQAFSNCRKLERIEFLCSKCENLTGYSNIFLYAGMDNDTGCEIVFGENVAYIPANLFNMGMQKNNLQRVESNSNSITFGSYAFTNCDRLMSIKLSATPEIEEQVIKGHAVDNCYRLAEIICPDIEELLIPCVYNGKTINKTLISQKESGLSDISIQNDILQEEDGRPVPAFVLELGEEKHILGAVYNTKTLQARHTDYSVIIADFAFYDNAILENLYLGQFIQDKKFVNGMHKIEKIMNGYTVYGKVLKIGNFAFYECPLKKCYVNPEVKTLGDFAFIATKTSYAYQVSYYKEKTGYYGSARIYFKNGYYRPGVNVLYNSYSITGFGGNDKRKIVLDKDDIDKLCKHAINISTQDDNGVNYTLDLSEWTNKDDGLSSELFAPIDNLKITYVGPYGQIEKLPLQCVGKATITTLVTGDKLKTNQQQSIEILEATTTAASYIDGLDVTGKLSIRAFTSQPFSGFNSTINAQVLDLQGVYGKLLDGCLANWDPPEGATLKIRSIMQNEDDGSTIYSSGLNGDMFRYNNLIFADRKVTPFGRLFGEGGDTSFVTDINTNKVTDYNKSKVITTTKYNVPSNLTTLYIKEGFIGINAFGDTIEIKNLYLGTNVQPSAKCCYASNMSNMSGIDEENSFYSENSTGNYYTLGTYTEESGYGKFAIGPISTAKESESKKFGLIYTNKAIVNIGSDVIGIADYAFGWKDICYSINNASNLVYIGNRAFAGLLCADSSNDSSNEERLCLNLAQMTKLKTISCLAFDAFCFGYVKDDPGEISILDSVNIGEFAFDQKSADHVFNGIFRFTYDENNELGYCHSECLREMAPSTLYLPDTRNARNLGVYSKETKTESYPRSKSNE